MSVLSLPFGRGSLLAPVTVVGLAVFTAGSALTVLASPAHADTFPMQSWSTPGSYTITVPAGAVSLNIDSLGGGGTSGQSAGGVSSGGAGGAGAAVNATYPVGVGDAVRPGDQLQVVVGAQGGGAPGGTGDGPGGAGGAGGGATYVLDLTARPGGEFLTVAGGGGGGGGAGGQFFGLTGGAGGTTSAGRAGTGFTTGAGRGGALGSSCTYLSFGDPAESAGSASLAGGGGGGGQGACGGQGGGSGDHGSLGGGGGGGAGYSWINGTVIDSVSAGTSTGDGSAALTFAVVNQVPQLVASLGSVPSTATVGKAYTGDLNAVGGDSIYRWTVWSGSWPPGLSLSPDGRLAGTPTVAGTYGFVARVTDGEQSAQYADIYVPVTVNPAPVVTVVLPDVAVGLSHAKLVKGSVQPFRLTVRNVGTIAATSPSLSITLPAGLKPQSATGAGWACHRSGQSYACTHAAAIRSGASSAMTLRARVTAPVKTVLTTTASVSVAPTDANPANNSVTNTASVVAK